MLVHEFSFSHLLLPVFSGIICESQIFKQIIAVALRSCVNHWLPISGFSSNTISLKMVLCLMVENCNGLDKGTEIFLYQEHFNPKFLCGIILIIFPYGRFSFEKAIFFSHYALFIHKFYFQKLLFLARLEYSSYCKIVKVNLSLGRGKI